MCGIVGAIARRDVPGILIEGLRRLEYRGYDSAGLAVIPHGTARIERRRRVGKVKELADSLNSEPLMGNVGIAHTRWATHGAPVERNAHPHMSRDRICVVHNGIIENFEQIRRELQEKGYRFDSDTDSEVIAHLIESLKTDGRSLVDAVRLATQRLEGAYAIGVISRDEPDRLVGVRIGSPLVVGIGIGENFLASDVLALRPVTDRFVFLEEGDLVELTANDMLVWSVSNESVVRSTVRVQLDRDDVDKGNYRHHMLKEIHEQPKVIRDTLEGRITKTRVLEPAFGVKAGPIFDRVKSVTIVACGSSFYTGSIAKYWIEGLAGLPCQVEIASEYRYRGVAVPPDSLFVTISQSGETADTLAALRMAKSAGYAATLTLCNVATSSIVRESDLALTLEAGPEIGVASTKAFVAQLVDLALLTILLARRRGLSAEREAELVSALHALPGIVEETLGLDSVTEKLAEQFMDLRHALFLGRGSLYPVALEGALKLKEISYIHAEGYPAGELKHGPLALVDENMPVVAVAPNDDLLSKLQSNLQVVRARGGKLYVFADRNAGFVNEPGVTVIPVPSVHEMLAPIVYTVPLQLLAYHAAVLKGTDVDQPRNLAKSVTVE
jgi:glutamine---fructose-6-phosphate transaminase (isomerizing)